MLEPKDLLQIAEFLIFSHLLYRRIPDIARLTPEWKHAEAVAAYLVGKGIAAERLRATSYGSSRPVATNSTEEGRAENRRVEFSVMP